MTRFVDSGRDLHDLVLTTVDVRCPRCAAHALLVPRRDGSPSLRMPRRLSCSTCGFTRDHDGDVLRFGGDGVDPCFGYPLWFRTETRHGTLWAFHRAHLEELRAYVVAGNRDRSHLVTWRNRGYLSRLPAWIRAAKNRAAVSAALDRMLATGDTVGRTGRNR